MLPMLTDATAGDPVTVLLRRLDVHVPVPRPAHPGDAAFDLVTTETVGLPPGGGRRTVGTGLAIACPSGVAALVLPRSGLAARAGVTVLNAPGLVDAGYRGEIRVTLLNTDPDRAVTLERGDRIAQLLVLPFPGVRFLVVDRLPGSMRAERGFGSTGGAGALTPVPDPGQRGHDT